MHLAATARLSGGRRVVSPAACAFRNHRPGRQASESCRRPAATHRGFSSQGAPAPAQRASAWLAFCNDWNEVLARRPLAVVVFFNATGTLTWATLFGALSSSSVATAALVAPDYAVGWLVMRATVKIRMPLNLALASGFSKLAPALSLLKVSPLLTVVNADPETRRSLVSVRRSMFRSLGSRRRRQVLRRILRSGSRAAAWLEGPIDKYGLSYFLSSKMTNVSTLCLATAASMHGLDVSSTLTSWGFSGDLQKDAGLFACAAAMNVPLVPVHFLGAVGAVKSLERAAAHAWEAKLEEVETKSGHSKSHLQPGGPGSKADTSKDEDTEPLTKEDFTRNAVSTAAFLAVSLDLAVAFYLMRRMAKSQKTESKQSDATSSEEEVPLTSRNSAEEASPTSSTAALPAAE